MFVCLKKWLYLFPILPAKYKEKKGVSRLLHNIVNTTYISTEKFLLSIDFCIYITYNMQCLPTGTYCKNTDTNNSEKPNDIHI